MNYFENVYLGKAYNKKTLDASKKLQKLLSTKALKSSADSSSLTANDFQKMQPQPINTCRIAEIDFDNFIRPYEVI